MDSELATLASDISPYVTAAIGAYGAAVLSTARDQAADATVGLGRRFLQRIFGRRLPEETPSAVTELAASPDDLDLQAALRVAIRHALAADPELVADLRQQLDGAGAGGVTVTASGERSVAAQTISGVVVTGDNGTVVR
jgi:hypothetical protein